MSTKTHFTQILECSVIRNSVTIAGTKVCLYGDIGGAPIDIAYVFRNCTGMPVCGLFKAPVAEYQPTGCPWYDAHCLQK